jgi:hypothetical protein
MESSHVFGALLGSVDISSFEAAPEIPLIFPLWQERVRSRAVHWPYLSDGVVLVSGYVSGSERVHRSSAHKVFLGDIIIVVRVKVGRPLSGAVSPLGLGSFYIVNFICFSGRKLDVLMLPWLSSIDVLYFHRVPHELRRSDRSLLYFRELIRGVKRICSSGGVELDTFGLRELDIVVVQVGFRLIQPDMQTPRRCPLNIPVSIRELRFVHLLRPMELRRGPYPSVILY